MTSPVPSIAHSLTCLGVGEGRPSADRRQSAFLYRFGSTQFLMDCGDGASSAFRVAGGDFEALDAILISHMHSDHVGGFSMFIQSLWLSRRRRPLPVYAPAQAIPALRAWLAATLLPPPLLGFEIEWHALSGGDAFRFGNVSASAYAGTHLASLMRSFAGEFPTTSYEAFSFVFRDETRCVGHTADIGSVEDLAPLLRAKPELLVCELAHIDVEDTLSALRRDPPGQVIFVHVAQELWEQRISIEPKLREQLGEIPCALARDTLVVDF